MQAPSFAELSVTCKSNLCKQHHDKLFSPPSTAAESLTLCRLEWERVILMELYVLNVFIEALGFADFEF